MNEDSRERRRLVVELPEGVDAAVAPWLWAMEDGRALTLEYLADVDDATLDRSGPDGATIATLLFHIAAIEADWLYEEILVQPCPPDVAAVLNHDVRDDAGRLRGVGGEPLAVHLRRLAVVRAALRQSLTTMDAADFHRVRALPAYDVTPAWVLHHLLQHEAEHRGTIAGLASRTGA